MINVAVADDQLLFRKGLVTLINGFKNIRVVADAGNGKELIDSIASSAEEVHVALIDINMPVMNGIECLKRNRELHPHVKNIILTIHEEEEYITGFVEAGANGYLIKTAEVQEVEHCIRYVVKNDYYFNERIVKAMHSSLQRKSRQKNMLGLKGITAREKEVLTYICREYTSQEISQKLFISESTVNGHRNNLLLKIGCRNTAGLILFAIRNDLFDIHSTE